MAAMKKAMKKAAAHHAAPAAHPAMKKAMKAKAMKATPGGGLATLWPAGMDLRDKFLLAAQGWMGSLCLKVQR